MELRCVFVLALLCLVRASPYGYGVKGGAVAKAEAKAAAGSFGGFGVPLAIPAGGYSGSYSKSSASSFASSSASASSSSFSYSGGNSGAFTSAGGNGISGVGNGGCNSNDCSNNLSGSHDAASGQSGSYSTAAAGSLSASSSYPLNGLPQGCSSGDCSKQNPSSCVGSFCGTLNTENTLHKGLPSFGSTDSNISNDQSLAYNGGSTYESPEIKPKCNTPNCGTYSNTAPGNTPLEGGGAHVPAIYLTTPIKNPQDDIKCNDSFCQNTDFNDGDVGNDENLPSSYNVPSYTVTASDLETPSCGTGYCDTKQEYNHPSVEFGKKQPSGIPDKKHSETKCHTPDCSGTSDDIVVKKNSYNVISSTQLPSPQCKTENCAYYPSSLPSFRPNHGSTASSTTSDCGFSNCASQPQFTENKTPSYFSTPIPSLNFASAGSASNGAASVPYSGFSSYVKPSGGHFIPSTSTTTNYNPSISNNPYNSSPSAGNSYSTPNSIPKGSTIYTSPTSGSSSYNSAGGSSFTAPSIGYTGYNPTVISNSYHSSPAEPGNYNNPSISGTSYKAPSSESSAHTVSTSNSLLSNVGYSSSNTGSTFGTFSTSKPTDEYNKKPSVYTGGFGGPPGYLKPNDYSPPTKPASAQQRPFVQQPYFSTTTTISPHLPASSIPSVTHSSATGSDSAIYTGGFGGPSGLLSSFDEHATHIAKPNTDASTSATSNASAYTGGFGGSPGYLKPNDYSLPSNPSNAQQRPLVQQNFASTATLSPTVSTAKVSSPVTHTTVSGSSSTVYTGGFGGPSGLLAPSQTSPSELASHVTTSNHIANTAASASAASNAVVYKGGFGGPPGFLKPYDNSASVIPNSHVLNNGAYSQSTYSPSSSSGSALVGASANAQAGAYTGSYNHASPYSGHKIATGGCKDGCSTSKSNNENDDYSLNGADVTVSAESGAVLDTGIDASNSAYDHTKDSNHGSIACKNGCSGNGNKQTGFAQTNSGSYAGLGGDFGVAQATAKSFAGAAAGAGSYGLGGSFASSSASAHASTGAGTKGGYGRR